VRPTPRNVEPCSLLWEWVSEKYADFVEFIFVAAKHHSKHTKFVFGFALDGYC
jgi:hypothetical protein